MVRLIRSVLLVLLGFVMAQTMTPAYAGGGSRSKIQFPLVFTDRDYRAEISIEGTHLYLRKEITTDATDGTYDRLVRISTTHIGPACPEEPSLMASLYGGSEDNWHRVWWGTWFFQASTATDLNILYGSFWKMDTQEEWLQKAQLPSDANSKNPALTTTGGIWACVENR